MNDQPMGNVGMMPPPPPPTAPMGKPRPMLPGAGALIRHGFVVYKEEYKTFLALGCLYLVASIFFGGIFFGLGFLGSMLVKVNVWLAGLSVALLAIVALVGFYWVLAWIVLSMMHTVREYGEHIGFREALKRSKPQVWQFIWVNILVLLVLMGSFMLLGMVAFILFAPVALYGTLSLQFVAGIALIAALLVSAIIVLTWFGFATWVFIDEDARGLHTIALSKHLSHNHFLSIAWRLVVIAVVYCIIMGAIDWVLTMLFAHLPGVWGYTWAEMITNIIALLAGVPIISGAFFALYQAAHRIEVIDTSSQEHGEHRGMLIVLAAVGLLGIVALPITSVSVMSSIDHSNLISLNSARIADIDSLQSDLQLYYVTHNDAYPVALTQLLTSSESRLAGITVGELTDPQTHAFYRYETTTSQQSFVLCATLSSGRQYCKLGSASTATASQAAMTASSTPKSATK